jgi:hypothetical protein
MRMWGKEVVTAINPSQLSIDSDDDESIQWKVLGYASLLSGRILRSGKKAIVTEVASSLPSNDSDNGSIQFVIVGGSIFLCSCIHAAANFSTLLTI